MQTSISERPLLLVLGMGYCAVRFVQIYGAMFAQIAATTRRADKAEALTSSGIAALDFDGSRLSDELRAAASAASHVLVSIPPGERGDPALALLGPVLAENPTLEWIGYLSTTAVYGDQQGRWTDEETPVQPQSDRAVRRVQAEAGWRALANRERAVQIFRLSGIYGPGRNAIADLRAGTARRLAKPGQVFNRIHVDDVAQVIAAGVARPQAGPVFNLADEEPAASEEVVLFAARMLGVTPPPLVAYSEATLSPMAQSFWSESKRVSARKIQTELGVDLIFPTYREGLLALLAAGE